ncbi:hypothetical protein AVEN_262202-1 [Araneus ventricosus]|uniref:Uncharacterized protein n=1 Tax=Araneus ventricosus TaxID=182803 RepID=A0A4Y2MSX1_ARAVE|nr:hypothetical protein AVEN_262202-1 [Araneus ventricosus]
MRELLTKAWQELWNSSINARFLFGIFPEVSSNRCYGDFYTINQILTTYGPFSLHQNKYFGKSSACVCGLDEGTVSRIYGCPRFRLIREKFFPPDFHLLGYLDLILNKRACEGLKEIVTLLLRDSLG